MCTDAWNVNVVDYMIPCRVATWKCCRCNVQYNNECLPLYVIIMIITTTIIVIIMKVIIM